ncbi:MAG: TRAP transporter large permease subunit, partial [Dehalococcoidia bacterium]|nr:TRAP transporter large permease subunit [Dehalococcoidia bacterium]
MSIEVLSLILLVGFMGLLALGLPLAFITGGLGVALTLYLGGVPMLHLVVSRVFNLMGSYTMVAVPMFILMAAMLERSGIAEDLYGALHQWMGPVPGGLASATVLACTVMEAMTGIIGAGVVTMGLVALPAMLRRNYDKKLAMGCIMAGGSLGTLIPPSVVLIVYGLQANVSIGKLFLGGITP